MAALINEKQRGEIAAQASQVAGKVVGLFEDQLISADGSAAAVSAGAANGVAAQEVGTVMMANGSALAREGAITAGAHVLDVGALSLKELRSVVKCYNEAPWTTKEGLDAAVKAAASLPDDAAGGAEESKADGAAAAAGAAGDDDKAKFLVYSDDACLGKTAPPLGDLKIIHGDAIEVGKGKITAIVFWAKFAKGDYTTVNTFSAIATANPGINVLGISCDPNEEDAAKFVKKVGTFQPELGKSGLTIEADFTLAFDPGREAMRAFKAASKLMSLGVGMAYLIDAEGKIVWREQYSRGESTVGQFTDQLARLQKGTELLSNGPRPAGDDDEGEEEVCTNKEKIVIPGEEDY
eukprot:g666.t1